jgi:nucleoside phosphorylase
MTIDVLLLEDDPAKKTRLLSFLNGRRGDTFGRIDTSLCTADAIARMCSNDYDLLIADIVVPSSLGGAPDETYAVDLFHQIDERVGGIRPPRFSLAISAAEGLSPASREFFVGRPWGILKYDESNDEFLSTIEKICTFVAGQGQRDPVQRHCDVFMITALMDPEFVALENSRDITWSPLEPLDTTQFVRFGTLSCTGGAPVTIAAAFAPRMGPVAAAALTAKAVMQLKPKLILMCGICAGVPGKAAIGDVVAAEFAWDWQSGKYADMDGNEHFEIAPHQVPMDDRLRPALTLLKRDGDFWNSLAPLALQAKVSLPKLVLGPIASGSSVLADSRISDRIKATQHRSLTGLDMEVYGVYAAAQSCDPNVKFLALKAVCDNGDRQKDDKYQGYASQVAAAAATRLVGCYLSGIL